MTVSIEQSQRPRWPRARRTRAQELRTDEATLLRGEASGLPVELTDCSKGGLWSIMDVHCLLLSVADVLASHQHATARARDKEGVDSSR